MSDSLPLPAVEFVKLNVAVGAERVSMRVGGAGPTLVLFHSLLADASSFEPIAGSLAATHRLIFHFFTCACAAELQ